MGEVYRARDTRLNRTVAIKVLPSEVAGDPDLRSRFEREARAIAALDHPHICGIYDVGSVDSTHYLVMPHLEGQTLAARLEKGPLPLDQALKIGVEIADALDKAHRHDIIHRDLKPANIFLARGAPPPLASRSATDAPRAGRGRYADDKFRAVLLDFGLAKLRDTAGPISMSSMTRLATRAPETAHGMILGTVQYMAPEQVEGREADGRSDIWSLGVVIYEMVTGTRPFQGDSPASVIGAILKDTPPSISTRQPLAPRALNYVAERCLAKDPDERWQSIGDIGRLLGWIAANQKADAERQDRPRVARKERTAWFAATTLLLIALAFATPWRRPIAPTVDEVRLSVNPPERMVFALHNNATVPNPQFAVSPDGRSIAFVALGSGIRPAVWLRPMHEVNARLVQGTEDAQEPFWSPDSQWIGFLTGQGTLKKVFVSGGTVQTITSGITDFRGASWGPDDTLLIGTGYGGLYRVSAAGGTLQPVTELDSSKQEGSHRFPQFLPDGQHYVFTVRSGLAEQRGIYVSALGDKIRRLLIRSDGDAQYVAPGYLLFLDGNTLLAQAFDNERRQMVGQPTAVAAGVGRSSRGNGAFSVSSTTLAYAGSTLRPGRLTWFDRSGKPMGVIGPDGEHDYTDFRLSPDETRLAASLVDPKLSVPDIWLTDLVRGGTSRFTFGPGINASPVWSPGGERILFRTNRNGLIELYQKAASAGGNDEPFLLEKPAREGGIGVSTMFPTDYSPDGQYVAISAGEPSDLWLVPVTGDRKPVSLVRSPFDQGHASFSPNGRFIAYSTNESGRTTVRTVRGARRDAAAVGSQMADLDQRRIRTALASGRAGDLLPRRRPQAHGCASLLRSCAIWRSHRAVPDRRARRCEHVPHTLRSQPRRHPLPGAHPEW